MGAMCAPKVTSWRAIIVFKINIIITSAYALHTMIMLVGSDERVLGQGAPGSQKMGYY